MMHQYISHWPLAVWLGISLLSSPALCATKYRFDLQKIGVGRADSLRSLLAGSTLNTPFGVTALYKAGSNTLQLAQQIHRLMPTQTDYERVVITPQHIALMRKDGIHEVICRFDAEQHIARSQQLTLEKAAVGINSRGAPITAEKGPNKTIFLYRQLPLKAAGQISSTHGNTSFALGSSDAMHPFGAAGLTVRIAVPGHIFTRAVDGKEGAVGWNNLGDGYSTGLEVLTEVQLSSTRVGKLFN